MDTHQRAKEHTHTNAGSVYIITSRLAIIDQFFSSQWRMRYVCMPSLSDKPFDIVDNFYNFIYGRLLVHSDVVKMLLA
jgi:zona occludens toxin (predicted ATPase)